MSSKVSRFFGARLKSETNHNGFSSLSFENLVQKCVQTTRFQPLLNVNNVSRVRNTSSATWREKLIQKELNKIEEKRRQKLELLLKENKTGVINVDALDPVFHKTVCPVCTKPNALKIVKHCSSCGFELSPLDIEKLPANVFMSIIKGENLEHKVLFKDEDVLIFEDKFKISNFHLDAIPIKEVKDVTVLDRSHLPLIEKLFEKGVQMMKQSIVDHPFWKGKEIEDKLIVGFNFPVSVYHLHLHVVLPPLFHTNAFQYPRWLPYHKVVNDLKVHGRVQTYFENQHQSHEQESMQYWTKQVRLNHEQLLSELSLFTSTK